MRQEFQTLGHTRPFRLLGRMECLKIVRHIHSQNFRPPTDWYKGLANSDRVIRELAMRPDLVSRVRDVLEADVCLWGANVIRRKPGQQHNWHSDMESCHPTGGFASVWLGLMHVSEKTSPHFISGSHLIGKPVQQVACENEITPDQIRLDQLLQNARNICPDCAIAAPSLRSGEAVIFDGRIWHATVNSQRYFTRMALLLQYCKKGTAVRIVDTTSKKWPFPYSDVSPAIIELPEMRVP